MSLSKAMSEIANTAITKDKQGYGYNYSSLDGVLSVINKVLGKYDFFLTQLVSEKGIKTDVRNDNGEVVVSSGYLTIDRNLKSLSGKSNAIQDLGSQITYLKRYQVQALFGLNIEGDTDASEFSTDVKEMPKQTQQVKKQEPKQEKQSNKLEW